MSIARVRPVLALLAALAAWPGVASAQLDADFTATPTSGGSPLLVTFSDATTGGTPLSWNWAFGDGTFGNGTSPAHVYTVPGTYTVSLTVFGAGGGFDVETKTAFVTVDPVDVTVDFTATPTTGQGSLTVAFTDLTTSGQPVDAWSWDFGDGGTSSVQHPVHEYPQPGVYTVELTVQVGSQLDTKVATDLISIQAAFAPPEIVTHPGFGNLYSISTLDLDGDGLPEVVTSDGATNEIALFPNLGGGELGPGVVVSDFFEIDNPVGPHPADLDGDGRTDLLVRAVVPSRLLWKRNLGGTFAPAEELVPMPARPDVLETGDLDGDGDIDLLVASTDDDSVGWHENLDGLGDLAPVVHLSTSTLGPRGLAIGDVDADGDLDVAAVSVTDDTIAWFENTDGAGDFSFEKLVSTAYEDPRNVRIADVDGDGDGDLLVTTPQLRWFGNADGEGGAWTAHLIAASTPWRSLAPADVDGDGDTDLLAAGPADVVWFDNTDGLGDFAAGFQPQPFGSFAGNGLVIAPDLDADGDPDVVAAPNPGLEFRTALNVLVPSPWTHLGGGSVGAAGVPELAAKGTLEAGAPLTLTLSDAPGGTLALAWLSFSSVPFDALGGTVFASPPTAQFLRATDATGTWTQTIPWPAGLAPGVPFWLQFIVQDPSVPAGLTLSNAATATTP